MESTNTITEIIGKFATKICKLKSIGVFSSEAPNLNPLQLHTKLVCNNAPVSGNSSDTSEEIRTYDLKVHPHLVKVVAKDNDGNDGVEALKNIFDAVSALKLAYLKLQQAHIPYDPKKIVAADDEVVAELEKLCKFRRQFKKMQCSKARFDAALSSQLQAEIEAKEAFLGKLKSQNCAKDCEILRLQRELQGLEMGNEILIENIKRMRVVKREASVLSVDKFQNVYKAASQSIHNFAKPLISLMKASGWDLDKAANAIENGVVYSRRCDKKYAFEAYIALRMFHGIALSSYDVGYVLKFDDPIDALMANPDSDFAKYCQAKYLLVVHPKMEESFFRNLDHRAFIMSGRHPRTEFYQLFAKMAKWIWVLLGSVRSIDPNAALFSVNRGSAFSGLHMESVNEEKESDKECATYKVQFMIMPGFKIGQTIVKSRVYVA
ncbi:protein GRAVITROPIC IN THE LIGHT 1-like [Arachis stenosperma]|uniref:protein GRAVITROPIC IN THE LIGHT 1-like n=1 Tax=Arachis stenosperma TaxID=217475 RepID=UPI0025AC8164|nr:protein GRAVITROPIC IN THE LIGHT 1-like [Arachis stenosperma]